MVLLDVVYNHFGPEGNYLHAYAPEFFDPDRKTPWGSAIRFAAAPVREFFIENALYWLQEYRVDGLRLDAIDQIDDQSPEPVLEEPVLEELARRVRLTVTDRPVQIGRASWRERVCQYVQIQVIGGSVKKKEKS